MFPATSAVSKTWIGRWWFKVPYLLSMDFVEETANFCKALAEAITQREAAFGHFDVAHGHEWLLDLVVVVGCCGCVALEVSEQC